MKNQAIAQTLQSILELVDQFYYTRLKMSIASTTRIHSKLDFLTKDRECGIVCSPINIINHL